MRIKITTDAAWRNRTRMTATERCVWEKTDMSLAVQKNVNAEMEAEGNALWAEIMRQVEKEVAR